MRSATADDLDAVVALHARCFPSPLPEAYLRRELVENPLTQYWVAETMASTTNEASEESPVEVSLLAPARSTTRSADEHGATVIGYLSTWWLVDEAHISAIAVYPAHRRRGTARALVAALIAEARRRNMVLVTLEVREGNTAALRLYRGLGLSLVGRRAGYYQDTGEDALILTLQLPVLASG